MTSASTDLRRAAREIFAAGVAAVQPERLLPAQVELAGDELRVAGRVYRLRPGQQVHLFGSGKAAIGMARALLPILGSRLAGGCLVGNSAEEVEGLEVIRGSHPVPDRESLRGGRRLLAGLGGLAADDLFIYLLSGGSSALVEVPLEPLTLADLQETSRLLLRHDVPIGRINTVRKHLSALKGGRLGQATRARGLVLVISDVVGDDLATIGSGPLYADRTTYAQALEILNRAGLTGQVPPPVRAVLEEGAGGQRPETPAEPAANIEHFLLGTNRVALAGAARRAAELGFSSRIMTSSLEGEAEAAAAFICGLGLELAHYQPPPSPGTVLLFGGETTVRLSGTGRGGRNQQLALAALARLAGEPTLTLLSGGTDGIDGNSEAAGASADSTIWQRAREQSLDPAVYLANNDSYSFFHGTGGLVTTGPTGTNVMDIIVLTIHPKEAA
jgi:hydroxypyruvate reductase/glycerate 2-kinase